MNTRPLNFQQLPASFAELVNPQRTALVMWDMQKGLAGNAPNLATLKPAAALLLAAAGEAGVLVAWSQHSFPAMENMPGPWLAWMMRKQGVSRPEDLRPMFQAGTPETEFLDGFAPLPHHLVLPKQQPSLFLDTPFDSHLKSRGIRTIVVAGFATDIGVELTVRHGNALGYHAVVAEDACGAYAPASHDRSIAFLRDWSNVSTAAAVAAEWRKD
ncbi:MAG: cysteine hydrolase [Pseudomonadota bacterium]